MGGVQQILTSAFENADSKLKPQNSIGAVHEATRKTLFIIAASLVVLVAIRNSITWHMEQFWGASKTFFSEKWAYLYQLSGENDFIMYVLGTQVFGIIVYFIANSFFMFLDLTGRPQYLHKYKVQDDKNVPVSWEKYKKSLKVILFNSIVVSAIFQLITWPIASWRRLRCGYELPTFPQVVFHLLFYIIIVEIGFYYTHRLFHHRYLYSRIHKIHHEWTAPVSIVSIYCHPLEHFFVNLLPIFGGSLLLGDFFGNHLASVWLFLMVSIINTTCTHSGYHLPFLASPEAHDFHHSKFIYNFGAIGILDRLHGTDGVFRCSKSYERHFILTGLSSAKQLVPDSQKKQDKS